MVPGAIPASYKMGTGSFPGVKRPGCVVDYQPCIQRRGWRKSRAIRLLPSGPSWPVLGWNLPLRTYINIYIHIHTFIYISTYIHTHMCIFHTLYIPRVQNFIQVTTECGKVQHSTYEYKNKEHTAPSESKCTNMVTILSEHPTISHGISRCHKTFITYSCKFNMNNL